MSTPRPEGQGCIGRPTETSVACGRGFLFHKMLGEGNEG